ncbi:MAG: hypothetical protein HFH53_00875 [Hespellia sp.]|jgi:hypothetical protein|nr:hypothetical protein [Hespellia sp.]
MISGRRTACDRKKSNGIRRQSVLEVICVLGRPGPCEHEKEERECMDACRCKRCMQIYGDVRPVSVDRP